MVTRTLAGGVVGRAEELAQIDAFLTRGWTGSAALVVEGEAGIGKTTLWSCGVERAHERGFRVLVARPAEAEQALSFAALGDLLAGEHAQIRSLPLPQQRPLSRALLLEDAGGAPVEPRAVAVALLALLKAIAREQPVLVAVDDGQWVDAPSATALSFALRRAADVPVATLLAQRTGSGISSGVELDPALDIGRIVAGPLSFGALRLLLAARLDMKLPRPLLRRIHDRAGGNAFVALELSRGLATRSRQPSPNEEIPVPESLERLAAERLRVLPIETREALAAASALGSARLELLDVEALEPAVAVGVVTVSGDRVRFDHPLLAAAAYSALGPERRRALHRRLADLVDGTEERARHLALAAEDDTDATLAALLDDAAGQARLRGAPDSAAELAEWALRLGGDDDPDVVARRTASIVEFRVVAGDRGEARAFLDAALSVTPPGTARSRLLLHRARFAGDRADDTVAWLHEALAGANGDHALEAEVLAQLAFMITNASRIADAEPYARRSVELAERVGNPILIVRALFAFAMNQILLGRPVSVELMEGALELDSQCETLPISLRPISTFAVLFLWAGDLDRARTLLERARWIGYERADVTVRDVVWYTALLECGTDEWPRLLELASELCALGDEIESAPDIAAGLALRAVVFAHVGDEQQARRALTESAALDPGDDDPAQLRSRALGLLELSLDKPAVALESIRPATAAPRARGIQEPALVIAFPIHAEAAIACGELEEAEDLIDWVEESAVRLDRAWAIACAARCRGLLAAARGEEAAAAAAFERALAAHARARSCRFDVARTLLAQGETLRRFKKKRAARGAIEAAIAIFDELDARLWGAKARRELARIGGRKRADGLTETESRVAELVAAGRSNREIANELFVTVRTVETHLTHVYAKLDVRSRTELVRRLSG